MIQISDQSVDINTLTEELSVSGLQRTILKQIAAKRTIYKYPSLSVLQFEIKYRSKIVSASRMLAAGGAQFAVFSKSKCNAAFWKLTEEGGFQLKETVTPSDGINDIFTNGWKYAFECTTAIVIVFYKGLIDSIGEESFNMHFPSLYLYDGKYDENLHLIEVKEEDSDYIPGDAQYFKNPEYNPKTPEWQGENVILLQNHMYFAHGIGIKTKKGVIASLNNFRVHGATVSAYLLDEAVRPDFAYLAQYRSGGREQTSDSVSKDPSLVYARIGTTTHILH